MSENAMFKLGLYARLERIAEEAFELFKQRREIEGWLDGDTSISFISDLELKWLKAQYHALGEALDALGKQREAIKVVLDDPNVFDKDKADTADHSSDTAEVIERLKKEDADLTCKLEKLDAFLNDDNKTAKVCEYQLEWMKYQHKLMVEYHRTLKNRIFDLQGHQHKGE